MDTSGRCWDGGAILRTSSPLRKQIPGGGIGCRRFHPWCHRFRPGHRCGRQAVRVGGRDRPTTLGCRRGARSPAPRVVPGRRSPLACHAGARGNAFQLDPRRHPATGCCPRASGHAFQLDPRRHPALGCHRRVRAHAFRHVPGCHPSPIDRGFRCRCRSDPASHGDAQSRGDGDPASHVDSQPQSFGETQSHGDGDAQSHGDVDSKSHGHGDTHGDGDANSHGDGDANSHRLTPHSPIPEPAPPSEACTPLAEACTPLALVSVATGCRRVALARGGRGPFPGSVGRLVREVLGERQGRQGQERRRQQAGFQRLDLRGLIVVDQGRGGRLVEPRLRCRCRDLVGRDEVDPGLDRRGDLGCHLRADPRVALDL